VIKPDAVGAIGFAKRHGLPLRTTTGWMKIFRCICALWKADDLMIRNAASELQSFRWRIAWNSLFRSRYLREQRFYMLDPLQSLLIRNHLFDENRFELAPFEIGHKMIPSPSRPARASITIRDLYQLPDSD
jgi:hypothetical protein